MGILRSKRRVVVAGVFASFAALLAATANAAPLTLHDVACADREVPANPRVDWNSVFISARGNIASARAALPGPLSNDALTRVIQAKDECSRSLTRDGRYVADANTCFAEASLLLAQLSQDRDNSEAVAHLNQSTQANLNDAVCKYATAALLGRRNPDQYAPANKGLGDALQARGDVASLDLAVRAYNESITARPTQRAYLSLARAYAARGNSADADNALARLLAMQPPTSSEFTVDDRAAAFAARARLASSPAQAQQLWQWSLSTAWSAQAAVELGKVQLDSGDRDGARRNFIDVSLRGNGDDRAEAYYQLSVLDSPEWHPGAYAPRASWRSAYTEAKNAESGRQRYRRQVCLTHIALGGDDYTSTNVARDKIADDRAADDNAGRVCTAADSDAEGMLLRGMYWLRRAQFNFQWDNNVWRDYVARADQAFADGARMSASATNRTLDWPGVGGQHMTIGAALAMGSSVVNYMQRLCVGTRPDSELFQYYDVRDCYPRPQ
ncbi:MAG: hypothetical protein QM759_05395 [Terricaulis sp.]